VEVKPVFQAIAERLQGTANVKTVYGEPITAEAYGFGGGSGKRGLGEGEACPEGEGGGGGVAAKPVGVVEITQNGTRFIDFAEKKKLLGAVAAGVLLGILIGKKFCKT
jgi:uncharacterized spore protein YtfJ